MKKKPVHLVDSHAHIYGPDFEKDFPEMMARAREAGVNHILTVGADVYSSRECCKLALQYDAVHAAVGIHPHDADTVTAACYDAIRTLATENPKVVAIGEIGLDFYRDRSSRESQDIVFRNFVRIARELALPIIVHDRDAHEEVMRVLREEKASEVGGVLHCFSGDLDMAKECIDMGFYISIPGTVTYPANEALRDVVRGVKIENLLVETDCPYLSPVPHRGKRNEPSYVRLAAEKIAELKKFSLADVGRITSLNVRRLFGISSAEEHAKIAYRIRNSLYLNITNRCSNRCSFCAKFDDFTVKGHYLMLDEDPSFAEIMAAIREQPEERSEVVFCGYGESLLRLDIVTKVAGELKKHGERIRINTDGQANLVHGRNILPELHNLVDVISVSLNAPDAATYAKLCNSPFGEKGFDGVCDFLAEAKKHIPHVVATVVTVPGIDIEATRRVAEDLGVEFRIREYAEVG